VEKELELGLLVSLVQQLPPTSWLSFVDANTKRARTFSPWMGHAHTSLNLSLRSSQVVS
jgi:hypothetical protein